MPAPPRILLINLINTNVEVEGGYPGLRLAYLVSFAQKHFPDSDIQYCIAEREIRKVTQEVFPSLVGISAVSHNFNIAIKYA